MTTFPTLLSIVSFCCAVSRATPCCEQRISESFLDAVVDMIAKAKTHSRAHCEGTRRASDCSELLEAGYNRSGVYTVWPASRVTESRPLEVYCDMDTDGGGWTLIQRRGNFGRPVDYFYKDWQSYKEGFGDLRKDFWLGNDNMFALTNQKIYSARFDLRSADNETRYAQYDTFWIDDENHKYTLHVTDYTGNAGDSLVEHHNNQKFSTKDQENDNQKEQYCAQLYKGAWWHNACHYSNLNGQYFGGKHESFADGIIWNSWKGYHESMVWTEIKIRPRKLFHASLNTPM